MRNKTKLFIIIAPVILFMGFCHACSEITQHSSIITTPDYSNRIQDLIKTGGEGGVVHIPEGTYFIRRTIRVPSNVSIRGMGSGSRLVLSEPFEGEQFITNADHFGGNREIEISNLEIEANIHTLPGNSAGLLRFENVDHLVLDHLTIHAKSGMFVIDLAANCRNSTIEKNVIRNDGAGGCIMVRNKDSKASHEVCSIKIVGNALSAHAVDEPLAVFGWNGRVRDIEIAENHINARGASFGITVFSIDRNNHSGKLSNVAILRNYIEGGNVGGLGIKGGAERVEADSNTIVDTKNDGIFIHQGGKGLPEAKNIRLINNSIKNSSRHGILASGIDIEIAANEIFSCKEVGIYASGSNIVMNKNNIVNCKEGILIAGDQIKASQNIVKGGSINVLKEYHPTLSGNIIDQ